MICCSLRASSLAASMLPMLRATRSFHGSVAEEDDHQHEEDHDGAVDDDDADDDVDKGEKEGVKMKMS